MTESKKEDPVVSKDVTFLGAQISKMSLMTIPDHINLYHGSVNKNTFDPDDIKLSDGTLLALFSNNPRLSSDSFMNCAYFPTVNGYLHQFYVKKPIPYIQVISPTTTKLTDLKALDVQFCQKEDNPKLNGFALPIKSKQPSEPGESQAYDYIFGLCNPNEFLVYKSSTICVNPFRLSAPINIF